MRKKNIILINLLLVMLWCLLSTKSFAVTEINLKANKDNVDVSEEFSITVDANSSNFAAYTIWIYFDSQMVECVSTANNLNVVENRAIYTWFSEDGINEDLDKLVQIEFKPKQDGVASFAVTGEFYNQNGEQIDVKYSQVEVGIGNYVGHFAATQNKGKGDDDAETTSENNKNVSDNNAKLEIMRLNQEGVKTDFSPDVHEYYLIVDEDTKKLDITAVPENREAEIKITGNDNLKNGLNKIKISVTSKDKSTTEEYVINVTRTENVEAANADLENLAVEEYQLSPDFQSTVTNYTIEVSNKDENLNILAIAQNETAKVKIRGNQDLKIGQNKIVITVTAANTITEKDYIINAYRRSKVEESVFEQEQQNTIEKANEVMQQMGENGNRDNAQEFDNESLNGVNSEGKSRAEDTVFMVGGIVLSIIVLGIVVIRVRVGLGQKEHS